MLEIGMALALILSLFAGREAIRKPTIIVLDGDRIVQEVKVKSPAIIVRDGDRIEVRQMRRKELKKLVRK